jgi:hypothetical protein
VHALKSVQVLEPVPTKPAPHAQWKPVDGGASSTQVLPAVEVRQLVFPPPAEHALKSRHAVVPVPA